MAETKLSPPIILQCLPWTRRIVASAIAVFCVSNLLAFALHSYDPDLFEQWLGWSRPMVERIGRFVPAITWVAQDMRERGHGLYAARIDTVITSIAFDCVIYLAALAAALPAMTRDLLRDGQKINAEIDRRVRSIKTQWLEEIGTGKKFDNIILLYALFSLAFLSFIYFGFGYSGPVPLYHNDIELLFAGIYFYAALSLPLSLLVLLFCRFLAKAKVSSVAKR